MCDTFVAVNEATADGSVILGKNSDREPNEAQPIVRVPATEFAPDCELRTTYVTVPQVLADPNRAAQQAVLDLGRRDGCQRRWGRHRQRGRLH